MQINSLLSALSLVSTFIYVYIGVYTFKQNTKSVIHRVFMLLCSSYAIWSFAYSFAYISKDNYAFSFWNKVSAVGWCSFSAITLYIVLLITENRAAEKRIIGILIFLPAIVFFYMAVFLFGEGIETPKVISNIFYIGDFLYDFLFELLSILILLIWGLKSDRARIKKQSGILVLTSIIPFALNLLAQFILPLFTDVRLPGMGQLYAVIMIIGTFMVITKYKFLRLPEKYILEEVANEMLDMVIILNEKGQIVKTSKHTLYMLGYEEGELIKRCIDYILDDKDKEKVSIYNIKENSRKYTDIHLLKKNGEKNPVNITCKKIIDREINDILGYILVIQDISMIYELQNKNETLRSIIDNNPLSIQVIDSDGFTIKVNASHTRLFGGIMPKHHSTFKNPLLEKMGYGELMNRARKGEVVYFPDVYYNPHDVFPEFPDKPVCMRMIMFPIFKNSNKPVEYVIMQEDITEKKERERQIEYLSYHDQLTGLYNRRFFEEELHRLDVKRNYPLTIVMADVNGLKLINDSLGHAMGDELLKKVAEVMIKGCRADDIIARLGGDEFVILLPKTDSLQAENITKRIKALSKQERVGSIELSVSFGYEIKENEDVKVQEVLKKAEDYMYKKKLYESPSMRGKTIKAIINTLHEKNKREEQHSYRVSQLCKSMGMALDLSEDKVEELKTTGLLHDIGKIATEERILNKPDKLSDDEWKEIKRHPEVGYRILNTVNDMLDVAEYVLAHHERWNGEGYPKYLKGEEIPLQSRIVAIADAYDAMTSERSYRSAMSEAAAVEELSKNAGIQFDPELVRLFIERVLGKSYNRIRSAL